MRAGEICFSIAAQAAWAPAAHSDEQWSNWAETSFDLAGDAQPRVAPMAPMLRRRAGLLGKMALEVAYQCLDGRVGVPSIFVSRHGEVGRAVELLTELAQQAPLSPTGFGLAVHNASAGLFSIARADRANHIALAAGPASVEHAVVEACGLLADGAPMVLLVSCDCPLPAVFGQFEDCVEQAHAWAWLMVPAGQDAISLRLEGAASAGETTKGELAGSLEVLRFQKGARTHLTRTAGRQRWHWSRDA